MNRAAKPLVSALGLGVVLALMMPTTANASPRYSPVHNAAPPIAAAATDDVDAAATEMQLIVGGALSSDASSFDYQVAIEAGVTAEFADEFAAGFSSVGGNVVGGPDASASQVDQFSASAAAACRGSNMYTWTPPNVRLWLNSCGANQINDTLRNGAAASGLFGILTGLLGAAPVAAVSAGVALLLNYGAGNYASCIARSSGSGIIVGGGTCVGQRSTR